MTLQQQIRANRFRSTIVVLGFVLLLLVFAGLIGLALDLSLGVVALGRRRVYGVFGIVRSRSLISGITQAQPVALTSSARSAGSSRTCRSAPGSR